MFATAKLEINFFWYSICKVNNASQADVAQLARAADL